MTACGTQDQGSAGPKSTAAAATQGAPGTVSLKDARATCAGFTTAQAADILGVAAADVSQKTEDVTPETRGCTYAAGNKRVSFTLRLAESLDEAKRDFANMREGFEISARAQEKATGKPIPEGAYSDILNIGDEGVWSVTNGSMAIRYKALEIIVMLPGDKRTQAAVATKIVDRLK